MLGGFHAVQAVELSLRERHAFGCSVCEAQPFGAAGQQIGVGLFSPLDLLRMDVHAGDVRETVLLERNGAADPQPGADLQGPRPLCGRQGGEHVAVHGLLAADPVVFGQRLVEVDALPVAEVDEPPPNRYIELRSAGPYASCTAGGIGYGVASGHCVICTSAM